MEKCLKIIYRSGAEHTVRYDDEVDDIYNQMLSIDDNDLVIPSFFHFETLKGNVLLRADQIDHMEIL